MCHSPILIPFKNVTMCIVNLYFTNLIYGWSIKLIICHFWQEVLHVDTCFYWLWESLHLTGIWSLCPYWQTHLIGCQTQTGNKSANQTNLKHMCHFLFSLFGLMTASSLPQVSLWGFKVTSNCRFMTWVTLVHVVTWVHTPLHRSQYMGRFWFALKV